MPECGQAATARVLNHAVFVVPICARTEWPSFCCTPSRPTNMEHLPIDCRPLAARGRTSAHVGSVDFDQNRRDVVFAAARVRKRNETAHCRFPALLQRRQDVALTQVPMQTVATQQKAVA
jgi:hypothetical protein